MDRYDDDDDYDDADDDDYDDDDEDDEDDGDDDDNDDDDEDDDYGNVALCASVLTASGGKRQCKSKVLLWRRHHPLMLNMSIVLKNGDFELKCLWLDCDSSVVNHLY